jgi:futalosine hydrolase
MILVVCALLPELGSWTARAGVERLACGVGPVEAAVATANALARGRYTAVVNAGIAGAFPGSARVGDAVLVEHETFSEFGLEGGAPLLLPGGAQLVASIAADAGLLARCAPIVADGGVRTGRGLTVAQVTTTDATSRRLHARYRADVESMEGFSVLRAAAVASVPAIEIRGISNLVGDRASSEWDFDAGARATARVLESVLDRIVRRDS